MTLTSGSDTPTGATSAASAVSTIIRNYSD